MKKFNEKEIMNILNKKTISEEEKAGLKIIYNDEDRSRVFETYLKINPEMAQKYLSFISKNPYLQYHKKSD